MCEALRKALPARKLPPVPSLRKTPRRAISSRAMWHLPPPAPAPPRTAFSISLFLPLSSFSPYTINSGLYHNTFSHKKCHRRASLMAPEKMDCFTRSLFKMRPLFLRVARVFPVYRGRVRHRCAGEVSLRAYTMFRWLFGCIVCFDMSIVSTTYRNVSFLAMDGTL